MKHDNEIKETKFKKYLDDATKKAAVPYEVKQKDGVSDKPCSEIGFNEFAEIHNNRYSDLNTHQANKEANQIIIESVGGLDDAIDASIDFEVSKMRERSSTMHKHLGFDDARAIAIKYYGLHEKALQVLLFNVVNECN